MVVDDLTSRGYLNDDAFARQWVETRSARGYGRARLRAELRMRGVAASIIDSALRALADDNELERARGLARRRFPALTRAGRARAPARLRDYLLRRGFSLAVVARVVRETSGAAADSPVDE